MSGLEVLVFDLKGDYAHFRKVYTTASQLTYGVPPRTTLAGLVAGILGLGRDSYYGLFSKENSRLSVSVMGPIKKQTINQNLLKTKDETLGLVKLSSRPPRNIERIQVPFEMVKDPWYRVRLWLRDEGVLRTLEGYLENHQSVYTPCLGISELLADVQYVGRLEATPEKGEVEIHSVTRGEEATIQVEPGKKYVRERMPGFFGEGRVPEYLDIIYEPDGKPIKASEAEYWRVGDQNVTLL